MVVFAILPDSMRVLPTKRFRLSSAVFPPYTANAYILSAYRGAALVICFMELSSRRDAFIDSIYVLCVVGKVIYISFPFYISTPHTEYPFLF